MEVTDLDLNQTTRKDAFIMLTDAVMHQLNWKMNHEFIKQKKHQQLETKEDKKNRARIISGTKFVVFMFAAMREWNWKEYSVLQGIAKGIQAEKDLFTFLHSLYRANTIDVDRQNGGKPGKNLILSKKHAENYLKSYGASSIIDLYPNIDKNSNYPHIIRQLEDRDAFLKDYHHGATKTSSADGGGEDDGVKATSLMDDAALYGCSELVSTLLTFVDCSRLYFTDSDSEERTRWVRLFYALCVNAYSYSWERGAGGMTTLNTILARGAAGPEPSNYRSWMNAIDESSEQQQQQLQGEQEDGGLSSQQLKHAKRDATDSIELVLSVILREILGHRDLGEYVRLTRQHVNSEGVNELSMHTVRVKIKDFVDTVLRKMSGNVPVLLLEANRQKGRALIEKYKDNLVTRSSNITERELGYIYELLDM